MDAGAGDGGGVDAGSPDAGGGACDPDAGPAVPRDGGSLVCAACSSSSACGATGVCRFVRADTCTGTCSDYDPPCPGLGPQPTSIVVTVEADAFACPARHEDGCDFVHRLDLATGQLALAIRLRGADGGVERPYGQLPAPAALPVSDSWCLGARDYAAGRCLDRSFTVAVDALAPDASVTVRWPLRAGHLPPRSLHDEVTEVLRLGDAVFRDAGVAWSRTPP